MRKKVLFLFFLSGVSGLMYEILWMKLLSRVFGVSSFAVGTVLSAFMLGMAIGSFLFGNICNKKTSPIKLFIWLELGIGLSALAVPHFLDLIMTWYSGIYQGNIPSFGEVSFFRFASAMLILIVPTSLMGGTLPVVSKILYKKGNLGEDVGALYAANTFGAVLGAFISTFFLIEYVGINQTNYIAILINVTVVLLALTLIGNTKKETSTSSVTNSILIWDSEKRHFSKGAILLFATAVSGFVSMGLEIVWTRILSLMFNNTVYAFSTILITFLFGIAAGSYFLKGWINRRKQMWSTYGVLQIIFGILSLLLIPLFRQIFIMFKSMGGNSLVSGWLDVSITKFVVCFITMLLPTFILGVTFPAGCKILENIIGEKENEIPAGSVVGIYSGFNTLGAVFGAALVSFFMVPRYGTQTTAIWLFYLMTGVGVFLVFMETEGSWKEKLILFSLAAGFVVGCVQFGDKFDIMFRKEMFGRDYKVIFSTEDESGLIEVLSDKTTGVRSIATNRHQQEGDNSTESVRSQKKQGYLPLLLKPDAKDIMVIGLGTGISISPIPYFLPNRVDCVEISQGIINAASLFKSENLQIHKNPRINIIREDGRNFLTTSPNKYDLIVSDLFTPYNVSVGNLYSLEHYQTCLNKLKPDGMTVQWLPLHQLSLNTFKIITKTFLSVFPNTTLWITRQSAALIGQKRFSAFDFGRMASSMNRRMIHSELKSLKLLDPCEFLVSFLMGQRELEMFCKKAPLNTDDKPLVEYVSPREFNMSKGNKMYYQILKSLILVSENSRIPVRNISTENRKKLQAYLKARMLLYRAKIAQSGRQYAKAISLYEETWKVRSSEKDAVKFLENHYITRGNQLHKQGFGDEGIQILKKALLYNPSSVLAISNIATINFVNYKYEKAKKWWGKALEIEPANCEAREGIKEANVREEFLQKEEKKSLS